MLYKKTYVQHFRGALVSRQIIESNSRNTKIHHLTRDSRLIFEKNIGMFAYQFINFSGKTLARCCTYVCSKIMLQVFRALAVFLQALSCILQALSCTA